MPHNHQCYTLGNHCAEFHSIPSVGRNQCKFPIRCKSPFSIYLNRRVRLICAFLYLIWQYNPFSALRSLSPLANMNYVVNEFSNIISATWENIAYDSARIAKSPISLCIRKAWTESFRSAWRNVGYNVLVYPQSTSEDYLIVWICRLI